MITMRTVTEPTWMAVTELHLIDQQTQDYIQVTILKALPGKLVLTEEPIDDVYVIIERAHN